MVDAVPLSSHTATGSGQAVASLESQPHGDRAFMRHTRPDPRRYGNPSTPCMKSSIRAICSGVGGRYRCPRFSFIDGWLNAGSARCGRILGVPVRAWHEARPEAGSECRFRISWASCFAGRLRDDACLRRAERRVQANRPLRAAALLGVMPCVERAVWAACIDGGTTGGRNQWR